MRLLRHSTKRLRKLRRRRSRGRRASGFLAIIGLIVLALYVLPGGWPQRAQAGTERAALQQPPRPAFDLHFKPPVSDASQIYYDNFTVAAGEVVTGDIVVTSGNARVEKAGVIEGNLTLVSGNLKIEEEGRIQGDLVAYSGNVKIERGGTVAGDLSSWSGNVTISGQVRGDVAVASGDLRLEETAHVGGNVSVLSGDLKREPGATVDGNVMMGPSFQFMVAPAFFANWMRGHAAAPFAPTAAESAAELETQQAANGEPASLRQRTGWFVLSLIGATVFAFVAMLLSGLMATVWPQYVEKIETISRRQLPLSFALGLLANVSLLLVGLLLVVLVCTIPFALVLLLGMVAINVAGWAALSSAVGRRVTTQSQASIQPAVRVAVGALVLTAPLALLTAFGGCLRFVAFLSALLLASAGSGAVVQDLLDQLGERNRRRREGGNGHNGGSSAPSGGSGPSTAAFQSARFAPFVDIDPAVDDFTRIHGIDEDADGRLLEAGITTFAQLAALTPEALAEIIGWAVERVRSENLLGRAEILAELS